MSKNLLPCPFCGGEAKLDINDNHTNKIFIYCKTCGISTDTYLPSDKQEAIAAWNRRAAGWIPTVERLPEENVDCLVYPASEEIVIARLVKGNFYYWWFDAFDSPDWVKVEGVVTHWMPLPKPPELCEGGGIDVTIR